MTKSPFEGAKTLINAAINPDFKDTRDAYYVDMRIKQANSLARYNNFSCIVYCPFKSICIKPAKLKSTLHMGINIMQD